MATKKKNDTGGRPQVPAKRLAQGDRGRPTTEGLVRVRADMTAEEVEAIDRLATAEGLRGRNVLVRRWILAALAKAEKSTSTAK